MMVAASAISAPVAPMAEPIPMCARASLRSTAKNGAPSAPHADGRGEYGVDGERDVPRRRPSPSPAASRAWETDLVEPGAAEDAGRESDHEQSAGQRLDQRARPATTCGITPMSIAARRRPRPAARCAWPGPRHGREQRVGQRARHGDRRGVVAAGQRDVHDLAERDERGAERQRRSAGATETAGRGGDHDSADGEEAAGKATTASGPVLRPSPSRCRRTSSHAPRGETNSLGSSWSKCRRSGPPGRLDRGLRRRHEARPARHGDRSPES